MSHTLLPIFAFILLIVGSIMIIRALMYRYGRTPFPTHEYGLVNEALLIAGCCYVLAGASWFMS